MGFRGSKARISMFRGSGTSWKHRAWIQAEKANISLFLLRKARCVDRDCEIVLCFFVESACGFGGVKLERGDRGGFREGRGRLVPGFQAAAHPVAKLARRANARKKRPKAPAQHDEPSSAPSAETSAVSAFQLIPGSAGTLSQLDPHCRRASSGAAALLVFLARTARTRIVAADLGCASHHWHRRR